MTYMLVSVIAAINPAIEHTKLVLFRPFKLGKWFVLGFCAWLAQLGEGGGNPAGASNVRSPAAAQAPAPGPGPLPNAPQGAAPALAPAPPDRFRQAMNWIQAHLGLAIGLLLAVVLITVSIGLLLTWLRSRGTFLFLDGVARNRAAVPQPWREYAREGNSLFRFLFLFGLTCFMVVLMIGSGAAGLALPDIRARQFGAAARTALAIGIPLLLVFILAISLVNLFLFDFVVPIMYVRRQGVMRSLGDYNRAILAGHVGTLALYVLFQIVMTIVLGFLGVLFCCGSLCLALLPYLGTVITLPLSVFRRAYSLYFLEQFSPDWQIITASAKPVGPPQWELDAS
jgi:hypothetical protein